MSENNNLDERLQRAFGASGPGATDSSVLDVENLQKRKPRARNPRMIKAATNGSLLSLGSLAVVGLVVSTFVNPVQEPLFTLASSDGFAATAESDMRIGMWVEYEYLVGDGLSSEPGTGPVYQMVLEGQPETVVAGLAEQFDIAGSPQQSQYFDPNYPGYVAGPEDWTGPSVSLTWNGTGPWYYSNPAAYPEPNCTEVEATDGSGEVYYECDNAVPEGDLPSAAEAQEQAAEIFQATGLDVSASDVRVLSNDEWGVGVSASLRIDGVETALEWSMYWAPGPVIASVSGHTAVPVARGNFDTVSAVDAVPRLDSGAWWGSPGPDYYGFMMGTESLLREATTDEGIISDEEVVEEPVTEEEFGEEVDPEVLPEVLPEPSLPEPIQPAEPEVVTLTVRSSDSTLLLVWDASGNAWIVPGYILRFGPEQWDWNAVVSLIEGIIEFPEPIEIGIMPVPEPYLEGE